MNPMQDTQADIKIAFRHATNSPKLNGGEVDFDHFFDTRPKAIKQAITNITTPELVIERQKPKIDLPPPPKMLNSRAFKTVRLTSEAEKEFSMEAIEANILKSGINHKYFDSALLTDINRFNLLNMLHKNQAVKEWQDKVDTIVKQAKAAESGKKQDAIGQATIGSSVGQTILRSPTKVSGKLEQ